ncbi:tyrosine-type recombinase/integrase [Micromonospora taraxaci]|uniref:tyrosine-type recombinase/integrase n=1 Tax=Micromonospora taraxaci TaxID=1316803 RepID=UPI003C2F5E36
MSSYDVRVYSIQKRQLTKGFSYGVRWKVAGRPFRDTFATRALAESFRSKLVVSQREGVAFDEASGLPEPMARALNTRSWYEHALAYVDMKWPRASAKHRKGIAETLATVTPALLSTDRGVPSDKALRAALYGWVFNKSRRNAGDPPAHLAAAVRWLKANTVDLTALTDAALVRKALDTLALRMDGAPASPSTIARKRAVFSGALKYAVELRLLDTHPMTLVSWTAPKTADEIDRGAVVNPDQARALLTEIGQTVPELEAFFGCMYYAALRPEEVLHLREDEYERPAQPDGWGMLHLTGSTVAVGRDWGDGDETAEERGLKHRAKSATRDVPVPPPLARLLNHHVKEYPAGSNGKLFVTRRGPGGRYVPTAGQPIPNNTYGKAWRNARAKVLTPAQQRSPLARRPYDLRHAAVSLWLNAGVPATQVAEWAGHSVHVLMRVYAKCVYGQEEAARRRVEAALGLPAPAADATRLAASVTDDLGDTHVTQPARSSGLEQD